MDFLEKNCNENTTYHSLWNTANAAFREKFTAFTAYVDIKNRSELNILTKNKKYDNKINRNK